MHLSDAFRMAQHGEVYEFHLFKRKEGVCCGGWLFGGQHCVAVCSNVGLITGDRLRNAATCHAQGSLARNGRLHPTSTTALHARRVIPYCCKLMIVNFCAWHTPTHHPQMMHWSSIGSLLYGTVFVIESRHRKMLILCVISAGELTIRENVASVHNYAIAEAQWT